MVPFYNTKIDSKILHSSQGLDGDDRSDMNKSFDSDAQVVFINPCDVEGFGMDKEADNSTAGVLSSHETAKMNILSNIYIGRKSSKVTNAYQKL